jgi:hypothetical protein
MSNYLRGLACSGNEQPGKGSSRVDPHWGGPDGVFSVRAAILQLQLPS